MYQGWQMPLPHMAGPMMMRAMPMPMRMAHPLMETAGGGFPVPEAISPDQFPPAVKESIMRLLQGPPKPAVTLAVMNQAQATMIAPDLPYKANV